MRIKTNELTGAALDWAVWACEKPNDEFLQQRRKCRPFSTDWAQGGPIIEREGIALHLWSSEEWIGDMGDWEAKGPTPLIAAMRCYVASKLGDEVEIPEAMQTAQEAV